MGSLCYVPEKQLGHVSLTVPLSLQGIKIGTGALLGPPNRILGSSNLGRSSNPSRWSSCNAPALQLGLFLGCLLIKLAPSLWAHAVNTLVTADAPLFSSLLSFSIQLINRMGQVWVQRKVTLFCSFINLFFTAQRDAELSSVHLGKSNEAHVTFFYFRVLGITLSD